MRIVIPTPKHREEYIESTAGKCLFKLDKITDQEKGYHSLDIRIDEKNTIGLSKLYNNHLSKPSWSWKDALLDGENNILFIHDDLEIHDAFFTEKLKKAHEIYDIVGLAGATSQDYTTPSPSVWHLSKQKPEDARGIVSHYIPKGFQGVSQSHYNSAYFGPTPSTVCVIDGLFMSIKMSALNGKYDIFDEDFDFHHYDMAMCQRATQLGLKIGVWPIFCVHHGLGEFNTPEWKESDRKFKEKYGNYKFKL